MDKEYINPLRKRHLAEYELMSAEQREMVMKHLANDEAVKMRRKEVMTPEKFKRYGINIIQWTIIVAIINGILCFLGKCSPIEALVLVETRIILWPLYAFTLFLILNYLVTGVFQFTKIPEMPDGNW